MKLFSDRIYIKWLIISVVLLAITLIVATLSNTYATTHAGVPVGDIILSNIPVFPVSFIYAYLAIIFAIILVILGICRPSRFPYMALSVSLLYLIRSACIVATHLGTPVGMPDGAQYAGIIHRYFFGGDLFFSGHVAAPFLMALIFWNHRILRFVFLSLAIVFSVVVLLGHFHYTIDVIAAYFIAYGVFHATKYLFPVARSYFAQDK